MKSLMNRGLSRFILFTVVILLVCLPLFYLLTKHFYAEDMIELIESVRQGQDIPADDLETDIMAGVMIQFALIIGILSIASVLTMRWVSKRLWIPFQDTLRKAEAFNVDDAELPSFMDTDVIEFHELEETLDKLMRRSADRYRQQKEFTENASHELQTPIAIMKSRLDILLQENLTKRQTEIVQNLYDIETRMARLNRSLLLLAKIENDQFMTCEQVDLESLAENNVSQLQEIYGKSVKVIESGRTIKVKANRQLTEIMLNNLLVNAFRHTSPEGQIVIAFEGDSFEISNTAQGSALDSERIFNRFNHHSDNEGTGIGLAIAKAICDHHGWQIRYRCSEGMHRFSVSLGPSVSIFR